MSELEKGKARAVYYLYGEEPFKIQEFVTKATKALFKEDEDLSFCIDRIDGSTASGGDVLEAIQSMGLFGGGGSRRLVLVRQSHQLKAVDALASTLMDSQEESPWGDNVLILMAETLDGRRKFHQWLKKKGHAFEFKLARDAELTQWVQYLAKKTGAKGITPEAAQMLAVVSEGSLYRLAQEIEKVWLYAGAAGAEAITADDVFAVTSSRINHEMVELVRAVLENKRTRALVLSERLIGASEDALGLVGFLTWALKNPGQAFVGTLVGGAWRANRLVDGLIELDEKVKTSGMDANALVEQFVIEQTSIPV